MIEHPHQELALHPRITGKSIMNQDKQKMIAYLYIIFTLFAVSFFGFFAIRPAITTITNLNKQLKDSENVSLALETKLQALVSLDSQYKNISNDLGLVYEAIPTSAQISSFTRQVEKLVQKNNAILNAFTIGTIEIYPVDQNGRKFYTFSFSLEAEGSDQNINSFISSLISFNRVLTIDKISTGKTQKGQSQATISGKVYFAQK